MSALPLRRWDCCPVCAGEALSPWVSFEPLAFVRCVGCGVVFKQFERTDLRPADFYEQSYFHGRRSGRDKRFGRRVRKAMSEIRTALEFGEARSLLDVGCSLGYVIEAGKRLGLKSAGADVSAYAVRVCEERGYRAKVGTLEALPFDDGEFDLIVLKHVLEHTPDPKAALSELRRVVSPRGLLTVAVPHLRYWKGLYRRRSYRYFRPDDLGQQHYVYHTEQSLCRQLQEGGFEVLAVGRRGLRRKAARGLLGWVRELARSVGLTAWEAVAKGLLLQREVFVVARRVALPPSAGSFLAGGADGP